MAAKNQASSMLASQTTSASLCRMLTRCACVTYEAYCPTNVLEAD